MICDQYRFVRIHIKKCGGRSFSALFPNLPDTHETIRDYEVIKKECNMPHNWNYPHHGKSIHDDYRNYYNDFTAACIGSLYAEEINYFKFSFDDRDQFGF
jgi:hypothetical protein